MLKPLLALFISTAVIVYLSTLIFPTTFVLGNAWLSPFLSAPMAALWITVLLGLAKPISDKLNIKNTDTYKMFLFYWVANFIAVWITTHLANITGFGSAAALWTAALALALDLAQWGALAATKQV